VEIAVVTAYVVISWSRVAGDNLWFLRLQNTFLAFSRAWEMSPVTEIPLIRKALHSNTRTTNHDLATCMRLSLCIEAKLLR